MSMRSPISFFMFNSVFKKVDELIFILQRELCHVEYIDKSKEGRSPVFKIEVAKRS